MKPATQATPLQSDPVYVFVGEGLGVPGLPHRLTVSEAKTLGVAEVLQAARANGNYRLEEVSNANPSTQ